MLDKLFLPLLFCLFSLSTIYSNEVTPLMIAIESGASLQEIQQLINSGEDVNAVEWEFLRAIKPVLRYAIDRKKREDKIEIIQMLIYAGADTNASTYNRVCDQSVYGIMPLISYAVIYSSPQVVQLLIEGGADVNQKFKGSRICGNKTPLQYAEELGKERTANILRDAGAISS